MTVSPYDRLIRARSICSQTPERSLKQRMDALAIANDVRTRRSQLKRDVKAGRVNVIDVISDPPEWALSMKMRDVLLPVPRIGRAKVDRMLGTAGVASTKTLGGVSERQRGGLIALLTWRLG